MPENPGRMPGALKGKRVHVTLRNGYRSRGPDPDGWPADGCCWDLRGNYPFDIVAYEVIGDG